MPNRRQDKIEITATDSIRYLLAAILRFSVDAVNGEPYAESRRDVVTSESNRRPAYGQQMAEYFRFAHAPSLVIGPPSKPPIAITHLVSDIGLTEQTASIPPERAFVVSIHLTPAAERGCEIWVDDRHSRISNWPAGGVGIYDLESNPRCCNPGPVDWVHYHVPRATIDAFTDDAEAARIRSLECIHGRVDPVLHGITQMMLPSVESPHRVSELFLDYFRLLFCAHIAQTYAPSFRTRREYRGGLTPWQQRRATELLAEHLDGSLRLATLASECGLSVSHFARSFRRSFGTSPHRYLILQRVERAKALLSRSASPLSDVALQTGFADQAAFSRTFGAVVGSPPGQWRRQAHHQPRFHTGVLRSGAVSGSRALT
jgi:AraC family transcriptional regulator